MTIFWYLSRLYVWVYQGCFWHSIRHDINTPYYDKPLIFIGVKFRKKLVSHHRVGLPTWVHHNACETKHHNINKIEYSLSVPRSRQEASCIVKWHLQLVWWRLAAMLQGWHEMKSMSPNDAGICKSNSIIKHGRRFSGLKCFLLIVERWRGETTVGKPHNLVVLSAENTVSKIY